MKHILTFFKKDPVLSIAALAAVITMFLVPPSAAYIAYIDVRVIVLLFCLMVTVAGLRKTGLFDAMARTLLAKTKTLRQVVLILMLLCFFSAMAVTNDVALLTFVPFAVLVLQRMGQQKWLPYTVVLQAAAANLGSMLTPVGNPQNLFLYSYYGFTAGDFFAVTLPAWALSLVLLCLLCLPVKGSAEAPRLSAAENSDATGGMAAEAEPLEKKGLLFYTVLFVLCLLTVFHVLHYGLLLLLLCAVVLVFDRSVFKLADYGLLVTFLCFFIFVGNLGEVEAVRNLLITALEGREFWLSVGLSQIISNVPAAVLLAGFTDAGKELLLGVNVGGLGTLIASLASLIAFRLYGASEGAETGKFMKLFTLVNVALLAVLCLFSLLISL